ncbi:hypothetical protein [Elizabethkingia anophelis]|uniref:hypothetical protein n=1 Tax=Elizabethkingia anophelis TaxID=1117645 RepID=UPI0038913677
MKVTLEQQENKIDWNKSQLLIAYNPTVIVMSSGEHELNNFNGMIIKSEHNYDYTYNTKWAKSKFELYSGKITLEND